MVQGLAFPEKRQCGEVDESLVLAGKARTQKICAAQQTLCQVRFGYYSVPRTFLYNEHELTRLGPTGKRVC
uniref:Uncharacterized protein n=1 Tax=mine drainage metagenome TaxID=410659 RepID=E6PJD0_9ZZZZ